MKHIIETITRDDGSILVDVEYSKMSPNEILNDMSMRLIKLATVFFIMETLHTVIVTYELLDTEYLSDVFGDCEI